jgi:hypothetical protein
MSVNRGRQSSPRRRRERRRISRRDAPLANDSDDESVSCAEGARERVTGKPRARQPRAAGTHSRAGAPRWSRRARGLTTRPHRRGSGRPLPRAGASPTGTDAAQAGCAGEGLAEAVPGVRRTRETKRTDAQHSTQRRSTAAQQQRQTLVGRAGDRQTTRKKGLVGSHLVMTTDDKACRT